MKILILKPSSLGDVVQALPVLRLLKASNPGHQIYWWLGADLLDLLEGDPDLSGIILFYRQRWAQLRYWGELLDSIRQIRRERFELVIDLQGLARSALVAWLAGAELRLGVEEWREGAPAFYDVLLRPPYPRAHAVDRYLEAARALKVPIHWNFTWLPLRREVALKLQEKWNPGGSRWLALHPGARWETKRWPVAYYAELVRQLSADDPELRFVVLGTKTDSALGAAISTSSPKRCLDLTGQTSLSELIEWLRISSVLVTNDSGPMHIAAALGIPVVSIFGPTDPNLTGPYGQIESALHIDLPCAPCFKPQCHFERPLACLREILPPEVCVRVRLHLNQRPSETRASASS